MNPKHTAPAKAPAPPLPAFHPTEHSYVEALLERYQALYHYADGRIDYSLSESAPVVTVYVKYHHRLLTLLRSDKVSTYQGKWNTVAGYIDEVKSVRDFALQELWEETGITEQQILGMGFGEPFSFTDDEISKTWITHPVLVELKSMPVVLLDFEHTQQRWAKPEELAALDAVPNFSVGFEKLMVSIAAQHAKVMNKKHTVTVRGDASRAPEQKAKKQKRKKQANAAQ
ncbi:hypothetical protein AUJ68_00775 [Candidatus Woesearchaeota archaeon CG1_02_57_44]|nr:MAG: hypothetical protein AUJ68_00775 [Candidatus Woesearchaeota archaeon CG1_02_57_44]PIN70633.1 MAG: hypothetical protein COV94_01455 [Candidatus Woesearchaeota archaeon CG11_big_fil_rev_8_21_14_0_20_57_5]